MAAMIAMRTLKQGFEIAAEFHEISLCWPFLTFRAFKNEQKNNSHHHFDSEN